MSIPQVDAFWNDVDSITGTHGGVLRCTTCHRESPVRSRYWREGWPKCCGYTMRWVTARELAKETQ